MEPPNYFYALIQELFILLVIHQMEVFIYHYPTQCWVKTLSIIFTTSSLRDDKIKTSEQNIQNKNPN